MTDISFKEFCRQRERMCAQYYDCKNCELFKYCEYEDRDTQKLLMRDTDKIESIVQEWAREHPEQAESPKEEKHAFPEYAEENYDTVREICQFIDNFPANALKTYEQGLEDAWELAKGLCAYKGDCMNALSNNEIIEIYGTRNVIEIMNKNTPLEAVQKLREWEDNNSFKSGDIIAFKDEIKAVVIDVESEETVVVLTENGFAESGIFKSAIRKTGRNVADKINALLEEIGGKRDGEV